MLPCSDAFSISDPSRSTRGADSFTASFFEALDPVAGGDVEGCDLPVPEDEGRDLARKASSMILSSRWVLTQKKVGLARCRLVVRGFASGADSQFKSGIG